MLLRGSTDALAAGPNERGHDLGAEALHALLRRVQGVRGEVEFEMEYVPRPEYGIVHPLLVERDGGVLGRGGAALLLLSTPAAVEVEDDGCARARFRVRAGESAHFALQYRP